MSTRTFREHGKGGWLSPAARLKLGDAVRAELAANPSASLDRLVTKTRAPLDMVRAVRAKWQRRQESTAP